MVSNDGLKEIDIKHGTCYYFDDIITVGDFDLKNVLLDEESYESSHEKILIVKFHRKPLWIQSHCVLGSIK